jgi:membrane fusion protein, multidrug efflux system
MGQTAMVEDMGMRPALFLLILTGGCRSQSDNRAVRPPVQSASLGAASAAGPAIAVADTATVMIPLALPSQLYVEHDATIYARSGGIVESVLVDLGAQVAAGQPLARLESADQRIALDQAQEKFNNSRQVLERQRSLKTAGIITEADSERVEYEHRAVMLELRKAQRDYELTRIVAPFAGLVTGRTARIGRLVQSGDSLFRLTALRPILAAVRVPEASAAGIGVGTGAEVVGLGGVTTQARVVRASPIVDAGSGTREMILQLTGGGPRLYPGASVTVRLGSRRRRVVAIPRTAVDPDGYALVWADDRTTLRQITLGSQLEGDLVEVLSGLEAGEKVLRTAP